MATRKPTSTSTPSPGQSSSGSRLLLLRTVATFGILGLGAALGAILTNQSVEGWLVGLIIAVLSIVLTMLVMISRV